MNRSDGSGFDRQDQAPAKAVMYPEEHKKAGGKDLRR